MWKALGLCRLVVGTWYYNINGSEWLPNICPLCVKGGIKAAKTTRTSKESRVFENWRSFLLIYLSSRKGHYSHKLYLCDKWKEQFTFSYSFMLSSTVSSQNINVFPVKILYRLSNNDSKCRLFKQTFRLLRQNWVIK